MPRVAIVTDRTADFPPGLAEEAGITVVPLTVAIGDTVYRDGIDLDAIRFMQLLGQSERLPVTSQPSPEAFASAYRRLAATHDAIISIHIAARLSGTTQSAMLAAREVDGEIPVTVLDSGTVSMGLGMLALTAARMAAGGADVATIREVLMREAAATDIVFVVESLESLRRGGRIGRAQQLVGTVLDLKPILRLTGGEISPLARTRTRRRAIRTMVDHVREAGAMRRLCVAYTGPRDDAEAILRDFELLVPRDRMYITTLGPVVATHAGPGVVGVIFQWEPATHG